MCRVAGSSKQRASAALGKLKDVDLAKEINKLPDPLKREIYRDTKSVVDNLSQAGLLEGRLSPVAQKIESCMERYAKYEGENPLKAKAALLSAMVLLKGAMGAAAGASGGVAEAVAGFGTGVFKGGTDEMRGAAVDYVAGDYISAAMHKGIEKISPVFIELDSTLNPQQAAILGMALAAVTLSSHEFSSFAKSLKTADLSGLKIADGKVDGMIGFKNEVKSGHTKNGVIDSGAVESVKVQIYDHQIKVEWDKQGKHQRGHNNFIEGKSELTYHNPQNLVNEFAGKGQPINKLPFASAGYKERFDAKVQIGYYVDLQGNKVPTTKGIITYSKKGVHVIPARP